jgi:hypothetical protein
MAGASLVRAKLDGAEYDLRSRFPRGFDPKQHGMKLRTA